MPVESTTPALSPPTHLPGAPSGRSADRATRPGVVLAVLLVSQLMVVLDATIVNVALPHIQQSLGFSATGLSWVINAYTLTFGGLMLLGARSGDLIGRRRTFLGGITLFTLASASGGLASTSAELLAARATQGVGAAFAAPSALALLMILYPESRQRARALGLYTAVSIGGAAIGLVAGGMLTAWASWRWVLFVNVPVGLALLVAAGLVVAETPRQRGRLDLAGAITSTTGMAALVYGFVSAATDGWKDTRTLGSFAAGGWLLVAFVLVERRASAPITPLHLFADRRRVTAYVSRLLLVAGMMGMFFFLTLFLQGVLGYSPIRTGLAFLPMTVAVFLASQAAARVLLERVGGGVLMVGGITLSTAAELWLTRLSPGSGYSSVLGPLLLFGTGNGLAFVPLTSLALVGVAPRDAGAASGLVNVMQQLGGALGLAVLVTVFGTAGRDTAGQRRAGVDAATAARHAFVVGADRAFLAAAVFLASTVLLLLTTGVRARRAAPALS